MNGKQNYHAQNKYCCHRSFHLYFPYFGWLAFCETSVLNTFTGSVFSGLWCLPVPCFKLTLSKVTPGLEKELGSCKMKLFKWD